MKCPQLLSPAFLLAGCLFEFGDAWDVYGLLFQDVPPWIYHYLDQSKTRPVLVHAEAIVGSLKHHFAIIKTALIYDFGLFRAAEEAENTFVYL